jgi:hypothetical protein
MMAVWNPKPLHRDLIGVYDGTMNLGDIERELRSHVRYAA